MKVLNLYAGIGGNRVLWGGCEVTAVEFNEAIAKAYQDRFPEDKVIIGCAKQFLLENYKNFDFIWASPPCQTHSRIRKCKVDCKPNKMGTIKAIYPDMSLWEIIIFLKHHLTRGQKFVVENVKPYYEPLIKETVEIDRHLYWSNFQISKIKINKKQIIEKTNISTLKDFDISKYKNIKNKQQVIRNQVDYEIGKHIFDESNKRGLF
ncbi:DNA cytosine methyltransferase [Malaciobacter mytili]|uniref:DNA cytosine methyltransferase n=1 Tax=Malaciobacter mytili TaxID=603050 RepID=UPI003BAECC98